MTQRELSDRAPADPATRPPAATERRLEAPHRRGGSRPRVVERVAVVAYTATERLLGRLPPGPVAAIIGTGAQLSYRLWPMKRRWSNRNFGHVLGLPPEHPDVRRLALRAYREYGRYLTELMRLPSLPADEVRGLVAPMDSDEVIRLWHDAPGGGLILTVGHMGSNEAVAASMAIHALPLSVVADDSSFPELFEHLRREREAWSVKLIPWRNLREIFGVLRRSEVLGLLVDWGYRSDGVPVRLFNAWTALPAGPATLAAKTGARILPLSVRRGPDGRYHVTLNPPIDVASLEPAELQRATQAMADALATTIAAAPEQWYSFKPMWPSDPDEMADLERRASLMQAGQPDPGPASP